MPAPARGQGDVEGPLSPPAPLCRPWQGAEDPDSTPCYHQIHASTKEKREGINLQII